MKRICMTYSYILLSNLYTNPDEGPSELKHVSVPHRYNIYRVIQGERGAIVLVISRIKVHMNMCEVKLGY